MVHIIQFAGVLAVAAALVFVAIIVRRRDSARAVDVLRNHVSFAAADPVARTWRGGQVLEDFANYLRRRPVQYRMTPIVQDGDEAYFSVCWFEDDFHRVVIRPTGRAPGHWFLRHSFGLGLSETIDYWLKSSTRFADVRWYSQAEWDAMRPGQDRPW